MTKDERRELIAAVREALGPFKEELKTELKAEIQTELLEPMETRLREDLRGEMGEMETRLRGEMGEMETRLRDDFGSRLDRLEAEIHGVTDDIIGPFIKMAAARHKELVERLDRLEQRANRNSDKIDRLFLKLDMQERRLLSISDKVTEIHQRLNILERQLSGEITYGVTEPQWVVADERSIYEIIRDLEERMAHLEAEMEKAKGETK